MIVGWLTWAWKAGIRNDNDKQGGGKFGDFPS